MKLSKTVDFARNFAVMVRVRGPDPKGMNMRRHAFHRYRSGETTLSASGMLVTYTLSDTQRAKVVEAKTPQSYESIQPELMHMHGRFPAMLETTAAVHPGASGGAVINSDGHMIGLVMSNARHGGGVVIPHLNFSIPSAALVPIFKFSKDMQNFWLSRILDEPDEYISSVWALMRPSSPKLHAMPDLPQSLVDNKSTEEKGSRFAKFIAERDDIFKAPCIGKSGVLNKEVMTQNIVVDGCTCDLYTFWTGIFCTGSY